MAGGPVYRDTRFSDWRKNVLFMETVPCNLCGSSQAAQEYEVSDYYFERPEVIARLVRCQSCGLVYQNPRPTLEEMGQHYLPEYELYSATNEGSGSGFKARLMERAIRYGMDKRASFVTRHKAGGRWLDVGCAAGTFLHSIQQTPARSSWELYGVEINPAAADIARTWYGLNVFTGSLEQADYPDRYFDAITLWDVLEHLHSPVESLREIRRILKPEGILALRVPNLQSWDARVFGRYWAGLEPPRHLFVFSPETLTRLLQKAGFQVQEISTRVGSYPTFVLSARFWLYGHGVSASHRQSIIRALQHPVARVISAPLFFVSSVLKRGPQMVIRATQAG